MNINIVGLGPLKYLQQLTGYTTECIAFAFYIDLLYCFRVRY